MKLKHNSVSKELGALTSILKKNAHPSFTYVFSYFISFSHASKMVNPHHIMDTKFIVDLFDGKENCIMKECSTPLLYTIYGICYYLFTVK